MTTTERAIAQVERHAAHNYHPLPVVIDTADGVVALALALDLDQ